MKVICDSQQKQFVSKVGSRESLGFSIDVKKAVKFDDNDGDRAWYLALKAEWKGYGHFYVSEI